MTRFGSGSTKNPESTTKFDGKAKVHPPTPFWMILRVVSNPNGGTPPEKVRLDVFTLELKKILIIWAMEVSITVFEVPVILAKVTVEEVGAALGYPITTASQLASTGLNNPKGMNPGFRDAERKVTRCPN